jgi:hypothetical protein
MYRGLFINSGFLGGLLENPLGEAGSSTEPQSGEGSPLD